MIISLEDAQQWVKRWGDCVDFCPHLNADNMAEQSELHAYAEDDSFGPVVRWIACKDCMTNTKKNDPGFAMEPVVGYDMDEVNSWFEAFERALELYDSNTIKAVATVSAKEYHTGQFMAPIIISRQFLEVLAEMAPQVYPNNEKFHLLCKWMPIEGQHLRMLIIVYLKSGEEFVPLPDLTAPQSA